MPVGGNIAHHSIECCIILHMAVSNNFMQFFFFFFKIKSQSRCQDVLIFVISNSWCSVFIFHSTENVLYTFYEKQIQELALQADINHAKLETVHCAEIN